MEKILILDFGGQYDQLIARRVREQHVYAEIRSYRQITVKEIREAGYRGIVFTGGPNSVYEEDAPRFDPDILEVRIPILGICYGHQLLAELSGGTVRFAEDAGEYGKTGLYRRTENGYDSILLKDVPEESVCWMSHRDQVADLPEGFYKTAETKQCRYAAIEDPVRNLYGVQFHPEVTHTAFGMQILRNFLFSACHCKADWTMEDFLERSVCELSSAYADKKVLLALSGGVDSSVAAVLMHKAIGKNLTCVFVDHGLLRKGEADYVEETFRDRFGLHFIRINAESRFLARLKGISEPEEKRKAIGEEFIRVFEDAAKHLGTVQVLCQGTIYPDIVESGKGGSAVIKSHHNVGGLPSVIAFDEVAEPLKTLFKDEVRSLGNKLGLPEPLVRRQPFPGPGLAVRVIGEVTKEKLDIVRDTDQILREEIEKAALPSLPDQYFTVLTNLRSVGVTGDARTYGFIVALRAVTTDDFMTAEWARLPYEVIERISGRITNEVKGVSRVVYDVTSKPPATVEWE